MSANPSLSTQPGLVQPAVDPSTPTSKDAIGSHIETLLLKRCRAWGAGNGLDSDAVSIAQTNHVEEPIPAAVLVGLTTKHQSGSYKGCQEGQGVTWVNHSSDLSAWLAASCEYTEQLPVVQEAVQALLSRPVDLLVTPLKEVEVDDAYRRAACSEDCTACGGEGEDQCGGCRGHKTESCSSCSGTGRTRRTEYETVTDWNGPTRQQSREVESMCNMCSGSGKRDCSRCMGRGKVSCGGCAGSGVITSFAEVRAYLESTGKLKTDGIQEDAAAWLKRQPLEFLVSHCVTPETHEADAEDLDQWVRRVTLKLPVSEVVLRVGDDEFLVHSYGRQADVQDMPAWLDRYVEPAVKELEDAVENLGFADSAASLRLVREAMAGSLERRPECRVGWVGRYGEGLSSALAARASRASADLWKSVSDSHRSKARWLGAALGGAWVMTYALGGLRSAFVGEDEAFGWAAACLDFLALLVGLFVAWVVPAYRHCRMMDDAVRRWLDPGRDTVPVFWARRSFVKRRVCCLGPALVLLLMCGAIVGQGGYGWEDESPRRASRRSEGHQAVAGGWVDGGMGGFTNGEPSGLEGSPHDGSSAATSVGAEGDGEGALAGAVSTAESSGGAGGGGDEGWTGRPDAWVSPGDAAREGAAAFDSTVLEQVTAVADWVESVAPRLRQLEQQAAPDADALVAQLDQHDSGRGNTRLATDAHRTLSALTNNPGLRDSLRDAAWHGSEPAFVRLMEMYGGSLLLEIEALNQYPLDQVQKAHVDWDGWSLLHYAAASGQSDVVVVLSDYMFNPANPTGRVRGSDRVEAVSGKPERHASSYHLAALMGNHAALRAMLPSRVARDSLHRQSGLRGSGEDNGPWSNQAIMGPHVDTRPAWQKWGSQGTPRSFEYEAIHIDWEAIGTRDPNMPAEWRDTRRPVRQRSPYGSDVDHDIRHAAYWISVEAIQYDPSINPFPLQASVEYNPFRDVTRGILTRRVTRDVRERYWRSVRDGGIPSPYRAVLTGEGQEGLVHSRSYEPPSEFSPHVGDIAGLTPLDYALIGGHADVARQLRLCGVPSVLPEGWESRRGVLEQLARIRRALDMPNTGGITPEESLDSITLRGLKLVVFHQDEEELQQGIALLEMAAESGHGDAMHVLGYVMLLPKYGIVDARLYAGWLRLAAESGHGGGMESYSQALMYGVGLPIDMRAGGLWLAQANDVEVSARSMALLGLVLQDIAPDVAMKWHQRAADLGDTLSMVQVGESYLPGGWGGEVDELEAVRWLRAAAAAAAAAGDVDAVSKLRELDDSGRRADRRTHE